MIKKYYLLIFILILCLFFRAYRYESFYGFGHDQDLFSWIARDQIIDKHFRLIGQETSITGIFIGPIFYDLVSIAFLFFKMDPRSANIVTILISLFTSFSFYYVISKFFNKKAGLIAALLYSISLGTVFFDRWVVPTQPTLLWSIWYLYALLSIISGNLKILPVLAILIGLIWHIHIAFIPLLILLPLSLWVYKKSYLKKPLGITFRNLILSLVIILILISPLLIFEVRHNFQQFNGVIKSLSEERGDVKGVMRAVKIIDSVSRSLSGAILYFQIQPHSFKEVYAIPILALTLAMVLRIKKIISCQQSLILGAWVVIVLLSQFMSKRQISEYYFESLVVILFMVFGLFFSYIYTFPKTRIPMIILLGTYLALNTSLLLRLPPANDNYDDRRKIVERIKQDAVSKGTPCIGVNYISDPGAGVGFRYLFWFYGLNIIKPSNQVPVYNIAIPKSYANPKELSFSSGYFGVIMPDKKTTDNKNVCDDPAYKFLPLSGFVN